MLAGFQIHPRQLRIRKAACLRIYGARRFFVNADIIMLFPADTGTDKIQIIKSRLRHTYDKGAAIRVRFKAFYVSRSGVSFLVRTGGCPHIAGKHGILRLIYPYRRLCKLCIGTVSV